MQRELQSTADQGLIRAYASAFAKNFPPSSIGHVRQSDTMTTLLQKRCYCYCFGGTGGPRGTNVTLRARTSTLAPGHYRDVARCVLQVASASKSSQRGDCTQSKTLIVFNRRLSRIVRSCTCDLMLRWPNNRAASFVKLICGIPIPVHTIVTSRTSLCLRPFSRVFVSWHVITSTTTFTTTLNASFSLVFRHTLYLVGNRDATYQRSGVKGGARQQLRRDHRNRLR